MTPITPTENAQIQSDALNEAISTEVQEAVTRYVVVDINANLYGMATDSTVELMSAAMTQITRVPHSPRFIKGVINHRGTIIPVIDARALLGFEPRGQEAKRLGELFETFRAEHENWLSALEHSVRNNTPFESQTDPAKCDFARWYASVLEGTVGECSAPLSEPMVNAIIKRLDEPHRRIHSIATKAIELRDNAEPGKAIELIEQTREIEFQALTQLFEQALGAVTRQFVSMLVIAEHEGNKAAIAVDAVSSVIDCKDNDIQPLPDTADNTEFLSGLVHQPDGGYILITDLGSIYTHACAEE